LKENKYVFDGKEYHLNRHGFARDREFELENQSPNEITFLLRSDDQSRKFILSILNCNYLPAAKCFARNL
jgi:galactose mutarotase-like enzyme